MHLGIDVAVDKQQVFQPVVVVVEEARAPGEEWDRRGTDARRPCGFRKSAIVLVSIERGGLAVEVADGNVEPAVVVVVGEVHSHPGPLATVLVDGDAGGERDFLKGPVAAVAIELVGLCVVGHQQVGPAVVVVVAPDGAKASVIHGVDARARGDVGEDAVPVVVIEDVALPLQPARAAHHGKPTVRAVHTGDAGARQRRCGEVEIDVSRDEQIEEAVVVEVSPRRARAPAAAGQAGPGRHLSEGAVAVIAEQDVVAVERQVQIVEAVVVVIADGNPLSPPAARYPGFLCHIGEGAVAVAVIEVRMLHGRFRADGRPVREEQIEDAVVVVIEEGDSRAGRLEDVGVRVRAAEHGAVFQTRGGSDVGEG